MLNFNRNCFAFLGRTTNILACSRVRRFPFFISSSKRFSHINFFNIQLRLRKLFEYVLGTVRQPCHLILNHLTPILRSFVNVNLDNCFPKQVHVVSSACTPVSWPTDDPRELVTLILNYDKLLKNFCSVLELWSSPKLFYSRRSKKEVLRKCSTSHQVLKCDEKIFQKASKFLKLLLVSSGNE